VLFSQYSDVRGSKAPRGISGRRLMNHLKFSNTCRLLTDMAKSGH
jgi:hypothetical protein